MSSVGVDVLTYEIRGSSVVAEKEPLTLWTATPMLWNAVQNWKAGQKLASATVAPVLGLIPQNPDVTAGSSRKPRPRTKRWRRPAPSRWKPPIAPVIPGMGPTR